MIKATGKSETVSRSRIFRNVVLASVLLIGVTLFYGAQTIINSNRHTTLMISDILEERLALATSLIHYKLRELDFVGGIVQEQEQKITHYLYFDKLKSIQLLLQEIALRHSIDEIFLLDEDKQLLATSGRIAGEDDLQGPYSKLVDIMPGQAGLAQLPSAILKNESSFADSENGLPDMLTTMKLVVPLSHGQGDIYGYVVLVKFVNGNRSIVGSLAEATDFPFVIYGENQQTILSNLTSAIVPYPEDGLLSYGGTSYIGKLEPLYDLSGSLLAEFAVFMDQTIPVKQRRQQIFNSLLGLGVIICIVLCINFLMYKLKKSCIDLERAKLGAEAANAPKAESLARMRPQKCALSDAIVNHGDLTLKSDLADEKTVSTLQEQPSQVVLPDVLPGLDLHNGLKRVAGNAALYLNLLSSFRRKFGSSDREIARALHTAQGDEAREILLRVKGVAGNTGALALQKAARELESAVDETDSKKVDELCGNFSKELHVVFQSVRSLENLYRETRSEEISSKGDAGLST